MKKSRVSSFLTSCAITLVSSVLLSLPLNSTAAASPWPMFGGNPQHTGANMAERIDLPLAMEWFKIYHADDEYPGDIFQVSCVDDIAVITYDYWEPDSSSVVAEVRCVSRSHGTELWSKVYGDILSINQATIAYGKVYVQVANGFGSHVDAFDAHTGELVWSAPFRCQVGYYLAPTVINNRVFVNGGTYGGIYAFDAHTGQQLWFQRLSWWDFWTPGVLGDTVYCFVNGYLVTYDALSGAIGWELATKPPIDSSWRVGDMKMRTAPIMDSANHRAYVSWQGYIQAIDLAERRVLWSHAGQFHIGDHQAIQPALFESELLTIDSGQLVAYAAEDGQRLWHLSLPDFRSAPLCYPPAVAGGYVFVSSDSAVYAVNLMTHQVAWSAPTGGRLSVSEGTLFVGTRTSMVIAYSDLPTSVDDWTQSNTVAVSLMQNYPNPFNPTTTIRYSLPLKSQVTLTVYNLLGQAVATLVQTEQSAGTYEVGWDGTDQTGTPVASGVYLYRLEAGQQVLAKKMLMVR